MATRIASAPGMAAGIIYHDAGLSDRWTLGGGILSGLVAFYPNETQNLSRRLTVLLPESSGHHVAFGICISS